MSPREMQIRFIAEIIEVHRSIEERCDGLTTFLGTDRMTYFEGISERLLDIVRGLSGATARQNSYHDQLVALGAANVSWGYIEKLNEKLYMDDLDPKELAEWLLDYGEGKIFGTTVEPLRTEAVVEHGIRWPSNAELVEKHGLLPPRTTEDTGS